MFVEINRKITSSEERAQEILKSAARDYFEKKEFDFKSFLFETYNDKCGCGETYGVRLTLEDNDKCYEFAVTVCENGCTDS